MQDKLNKLKRLLKDLDSVAVAFSGGVDSTFLLRIAFDVLGNKAMAVIGRSPSFPKKEFEQATNLAEAIGVEYEIVNTCEMDNPDFTANPPERCFFCKSNLFETVWRIAKEKNLKAVIEGSNADDTSDFRPGMKAVKKFNVRSPLLEAGLTKVEIRSLSKELNLPTWNKPAMACLSSRIPYGETITEERLYRIEQAETALKNLGLLQVRVRDHNEVARIEVEASQIINITSDLFRDSVVKVLKQTGYKYVCLDLEGYRTGSMNEVLTLPQDV